MKTFLRHVLQTGVHKTRTLIERLDPMPASGNFSNPELAYVTANAMLEAFIAEQPERLRPSYTWGLLQGALLAKTLGLARVTAIEFGVAGGSGLVALERAAARIETALGVVIDVHGFDTGEGLPKPSDYRDHPNLYSESTFRMDVDRLRAALARAQLHLGPIAATVIGFIASRPAPIAFISFDLDYYSSTVDALRVLEGDHRLMLPRVHCYFDDIMGLTCSEFAGERLAIHEFNARHERRKISPIFGLRYFLPPRYAQQQWAEMMYLAHLFDHEMYGHNDGLARSAERPLEPRFPPLSDR